MTSFDVIRRLRRILGIRTMGHAGTLDPLATGLLIIGVGGGTKKLTPLIGLPKSYEAEILLGVRTDTSDTDGAVVETRTLSALDPETVRCAVESMTETHELPVSIYSAKKRGGRPLYDYARKGEQITPPVATMTVSSAVFISYEHPVVRVRFNVSSGTYIRSLAEELARRLGTVGTIRALRRLSIGEYRVEDARTLDEMSSVLPDTKNLLS